MALFIIFVVLAVTAYLLYNYFRDEPSYSNYNSSVSNSYSPKKEEVTGDDEEWISKFKDMTIAEARAEYKELKELGIFIPSKSYAFLMAKIKNEVYFSDEEFEKRKTEGKKLTYVSKLEYFLENSIELWLKTDIEYNEKNNLFKKLSTKVNGTSKRKLMLEVYTKLLNELISMDKDKEKIDFLKSEKRRLSIAITKGNVTAKEISFINIDNFIKGNELVFIDYTKQED